MLIPNRKISTLICKWEGVELAQVSFSHKHPSQIALTIRITN